MDTVLEVCVDSLDSAIAAERGGADRIELCSNLIIGGTTPGYELFKQVKEMVSIPVHVLIRPRFGDFLYSTSEKEIMKRELQQFAQMGADAVVVGMLNADGTLDTDGMQYILDGIQTRITLHRAFDMCADPFETASQAIALGIDTILTSGQKNDCMEGIGLIKKLVQKFSPADIQFMAGGGLKSPEQAKRLYDAGVRCFHMSGKRDVESEMRFRNGDVSMGLKVASEYVKWVTDAELVKAVKNFM